MQGISDPNCQILDAAAFCRELVEKGSVADFLADHRQRLFPDELFSDLFPSGRGRPSVPADVIAAVMVLQALEGLSDRDAARQLRTNIAWKVACGLALDDPGFHPTVLTLWRNKLRASKRPQRIFDAVREVVKQTGVLAGKQRRVLDSTVLDDAVTRQDALMQLVAQIRVVRRMVPEARALELKAHDYESGRAKPRCAWDDRADIDRVVTELVNDANTVLEAMSGLKLNDAQQEAVGLLALVAGQDVEPGDGDGTWRIAQRTAPDRVVSVHDPESRHVHKTSHNYRDGFKAHIAAEPETGLVTAYDLTAGNVGDAQAAPGLIADEPADMEVFGDSAYGSGAFRAHLRDTNRRAVIKPIPLREVVPGGFTIDDFAIDLEARTVTCPAGQTVPIGGKGSVTFGSRCTGCPLRSRCTTAKKGRHITLHPQHALLAEARAAAKTPEFQENIKKHRPMAERTIAWVVAKGHRKVRCRGIVRNKILLGHRCAGLNLRRLLNLGLHLGSEGWALAPAT
jgi:IS5 family transposase